MRFVALPNGKNPFLLIFWDKESQWTQSQISKKFQLPSLRVDQLTIQLTT
jgi:hypothetical protein